MQIALVIDPIETLSPKKDSSLAMMETAYHLGWKVYFLRPQDLFVQDTVAMGRVFETKVRRKEHPFYEIISEQIIALDSLDIILMRRDPPIDMEYMYACSMLGRVNPNGTLVSNNPQSLRLLNEKFLINWFPQWIAPTLFSKDPHTILKFLEAHDRCVVKPMDAMGGRGVFVIHRGDSNRNVILETLTDNFTKTIVVQKYLDQIREGDRRIIVIGGEPISTVMIRRPSSTDHRGNLAAGAVADTGRMTTQEEEMVKSLKPYLMEQGLHLVGMDVIGNNITEINFTSPTGFVEIEKASGENISARYLEFLKQLQNKKA